SPPRIALSPCTTLFRSARGAGEYGARGPEDPPQPRAVRDAQEVPLPSARLLDRVRRAHAQAQRETPRGREELPAGNRGAVPGVAPAGPGRAGPPTAGPSRSSRPPAAAGRIPRRAPSPRRGRLRQSYPPLPR